jgi:hypothetical protein
MIPKPRRNLLVALGTLLLFALPVLCATVDSLLLALLPALGA